MWIECNCELLSRKLDNLGINQDAIPARLCFHKDSVEGIREILEDGSNEPSQDKCLVMFKSGENYQIDISYGELKTKLKTSNL